MGSDCLHQPLFRLPMSYGALGMPKQMISFRLEEEDIGRLDAAAARAGLDRTKFILKAIGQTLPTPQPKPVDWEERVQERMRQLDPQQKTPNHTRKLAIRDVELEDLEKEGKQPWEGKSLHIHTQPRLDSQLSDEAKDAKARQMEEFTRRYGAGQK